MEDRINNLMSRILGCQEDCLNFLRHTQLKDDHNNNEYSCIYKYIAKVLDKQVIKFNLGENSGGNEKRTFRNIQLKKNDFQKKIYEHFRKCNEFKGSSIIELYDFLKSLTIEDGSKFKDKVRYEYLSSKNTDILFKSKSLYDAMSAKIDFGEDIAETEFITATTILVEIINAQSNDQRNKWLDFFENMLLLIEADDHNPDDTAKVNKILNEEKFPQIIARYFCNKFPSLLETIIYSQKNGRNDVKTDIENDILLNDNAKNTDVLSKVVKPLLKETRTDIISFLYVRNHLRNEYSGHYQGTETSPIDVNDSGNVARFILFTYIGTILSFYLICDKNNYTDSEEIRLTICYEGDLHPKLIKKGGTEPLLEVNKGDGFEEYIVKREDKLVVQCGSASCDVPLEKLLTFRPYVVWKDGVFKFFPSYYQIGHDTRTMIDDIYHRDMLRLVEKQTDNIRGGFDKQNLIYIASKNKEDVRNIVVEINKIANENVDYEAIAKIKGEADNLNNIAIKAFDKVGVSENKKDLEDAVNEIKDAFNQAQELLNDAKKSSSKIEIQINEEQYKQNIASIVKVEQELEIVQNTIKTYHINVQKEMSSLLADVKEQIESIKKSIKSSYQRRESVKDATNIARSVDDIKNKVGKLSEGASFMQRKIKINWGIFNAGALLWLLLLVVIIWYYVSVDKWNRNIDFFDHGEWYIAGIFTVGILCYLLAYWGCKKVKVLTNIKLWNVICCLGSIAPFVLVVIMTCTIPFLRPSSYVKNYDFLLHDIEYNTRAVEFVKSYYGEKTDNEDAMMMRAEYYMYYGSQQWLDSALLVTAPMTTSQGVKLYQRGCAYAANLLYKKKDYERVWFIIDEYKKQYENSTDYLLMGLEGMMLCKGEGHSQNMENGLKMLFDAAEANNAQAQYFIGYIHSHDIVDWNKIYEYKNTYGKIPEEEHIATNIEKAMEYYRRAAPLLHEASLEMCKLYASLNVEDSAHYYYEQVHRTPNDSIRGIAHYNMALLYYKKGEMSRCDSCLSKAVECKNYEAICWDASRTGDSERAIAKLSHETYRGDFYIAPIVFQYLFSNKNYRKEALQVLSKAHKDAGFNKYFIEGMEYCLRTKNVCTDNPTNDSIKGMELMKLSAENGCLYAQMICIYREQEQQILQGKGMKNDQLQKLHLIGEKIPFAYLLESILSLYVGDDDRALYNMNLASNHPKTGMIFSMSLSLSMFKKLMLNGKKDMKNSSDSIKLIMISSFLDKALCRNDTCYNKISLYRSLFLIRNTMKELESRSYEEITTQNKQDMRFWADIAMANHDFEMEASLLAYVASYEDYVYQKKLLESAIKDYQTILIDNDYLPLHEIDEDYKRYIQYIIAVLSNMDSQYVDRLSRMYSKYPTIQNLFFSPPNFKSVQKGFRFNMEYENIEGRNVFISNFIDNATLLYEMDNICISGKNIYY